MNIEVNFLSILIAAAAGMVVGFVWYSPMLFAKEWMRLTGKKPEDIKMNAETGKMYAISGVLALVTAYVLYHVMTLSMNFFNYSSITTGLITAFWMWLGFIMPVQATGVLFNGEKLKLFGINTGYQLVSLLVMGLVLGYIG